MCVQGGWGRREEEEVEVKEEKGSEYQVYKLDQLTGIKLVFIHI